MLINTIIFSIVVIGIFILFILLTKCEIVCPKCKSKNIVKTGKKIYKENPPIALFGSPDSYYQIEYKCSKCDYIFLKEQKAYIFN